MLPENAAILLLVTQWLPLSICLKVFDSSSRLLLRQFKGHKAPVHVVGFTENQLHVLSGGDDGLVALWDITSGQRVSSLWDKSGCWSHPVSR